RRACSAAASSPARYRARTSCAPHRRIRRKRRCAADIVACRTGHATTKVVAQAGATGLGDLDKDTIAKAYARWAPVYDLVFGAVFERGRLASIAAAERIGGCIL